MEIIEVDEEYLEGDDTMMFSCIKSAIVHFFKKNGINGIDVDIDGEEVNRIEVVGAEGSETLSVSYDGPAGTVKLSEADVADHRTTEGIRFRGLMCVAVGNFIPFGCGMVVPYKDKKYMVGVREDSVAVDLLDPEHAADVNLYDKFTIVHPNEAPQPVVVNGPMTEEMALDLLNKMQTTGKGGTTCI